MTTRSNTFNPVFAMGYKGNPVEYRGHGVDTGGLQVHSIGDTYPYMVVGTHHRRMGQASAATRFYVMNCATGDRYYWKLLSGEIVTWAHIGVAQGVAELLREGIEPLRVAKV